MERFRSIAPRCQRGMFCIEAGRVFTNAAAHGDFSGVISWNEFWGDTVGDTAAGKTLLMCQATGERLFDSVPGDDVAPASIAKSGREKTAVDIVGPGPRPAELWRLGYGADIEGRTRKDRASAAKQASSWCCGGPVLTATAQLCTIPRALRRCGRAGSR